MRLWRRGQRQENRQGKKDKSSLYEDEDKVLWNLVEQRKKKIAIVGTCRGAGATFVATTTARIFSQKPELDKKISLIEMRYPAEGEGKIFHAAGLDKSPLGCRYTDFLTLYLEGNELPQSANLHWGINWAVWPEWAVSGKTKVDAENETENRNHLADFPMYKLPGKYIFADNPPIDSSLQKYDLVIAVVDPMPAEMYAGAAAYEKLTDMEASGLHVLWVLNKDNEEVNHEAVKHFLKRREWHCLPLVDGKTLYRAQYKGKLTIDEMSEEESAPFYKLAEEIQRKLP